MLDLFLYLPLLIIYTRWPILISITIRTSPHLQSLNPFTLLTWLLKFISFDDLASVHVCFKHVGKFEVAIGLVEILIGKVLIYLVGIGALLEEEVLFVEFIIYWLSHI